MSDTPKARSHNATFVTGSTMWHVVVMTFTSSIGLMAIFLVDLADLYFLSLLGEAEVAAAIGYAGTIIFFTISIGIGLSIASMATVSRAIGADDEVQAKSFVLSGLTVSVVISTLLVLILWPSLGFLLDGLGAEGRTHALALSYLQIVIPSFPILAFNMTATGILRATGDAKRSMYVTLSGGAINAILDPIFIFGLGLGVDGAAIASVLSRFGAMLVAFYGMYYVHNLLPHMPRLPWLRRDAPAIFAIAIPAILTNLATPVGNAFVTALMAPFGDGAVAGWAIIGRITPVAFGGIFALSGAIGPILGQNLGAQRFDRVRGALTDALRFVVCYMLVVWCLLTIASGYLPEMFQATGAAADLIRVFCVWISPSFVFMGALFVSNAAFNNLGRPHYSTILNWGRATLGTIPLAYLGGEFFGATGVVAGSLLGGVFFAAIGVYTCYRLIDRYQRHADLPETDSPRLQRRFPLWPFSSQRG